MPPIVMGQAVGAASVSASLSASGVAAGATWSDLERSAREAVSRSSTRIWLNGAILGKGPMSFESR